MLSFDGEKNQSDFLFGDLPAQFHNLVWRNPLRESLPSSFEINLLILRASPKQIVEIPHNLILNIKGVVDPRTILSTNIDNLAPIIVILYGLKEKARVLVSKIQPLDTGFLTLHSPRVRIDGSVELPSPLPLVDPLSPSVPPSWSFSLAFPRPLELVDRPLSTSDASRFHRRI